MSRKLISSMTVTILLLFAALLAAPMALAQEGIIPFSSESWMMINAEVVEHMDRECLVGFATLNGVSLESGVIEVDVAVTGARSYPGIVFRVQSGQDYERLYIRPHRADLYPDAIQYTPVINGIAGWQLYNGDGYTAGMSIPADEWIHLRLEFSGSQARLFVDDEDQPALSIDYLKHGVSKGSVGLHGPRDRTAFFSNFEYRVDESLRFDPPPVVETPPGMITEWEVSQQIKMGEIDMELHPGQQDLGEIAWQKVESEASGLVDLARYLPRTGREPDCVLVKKNLHAEDDKLFEFMFGYSDAVSIFLNGEVLFSGASAYRQRDPSFLGIVGPFDSVYLPLKRGDNELLMVIAESFGGWGFMGQDGDAVFHHSSIEVEFETPTDLVIPESVVYDPENERLYVSNFDSYGSLMQQGGQYISKLSLDGEMQSRTWITGLRMPTGMAVYEGKLLIVQRSGIAEVDIESGEIVNQYPGTGARFLNDIVADESGVAYVTDSGGGAIFRLADGAFELWLSGEGIGAPNGIELDGERLIIGDNSDQRLKAIDLETKSVSTIARLGPGIMDGIQVDENGDYLVSQWEGRVYRITPAGEMEKLIDTSVTGINCADFEYVADRNLLVIPTFMDNRVVGYSITE